MNKNNFCFIILFLLFLFQIIKSRGSCIPDTLSSRALGLAAFRPSACEQRYLAYSRGSGTDP